MRNNHTEIFIDFHHRTLSGHSHHNEHECDKEGEKQEMENCRADMEILKKKLEDEKNEREMEQEKKRVVQDYETTQMERAQKMGEQLRR